MADNANRRRQISIQAILVLTLIFAVFAAGYRSGYQQSEIYDFEQLMELINDTIVVEEEWEDLGGPSSMEPFPENISILYSAGPETKERNDADDQPLKDFGKIAEPGGDL